MRFMMVMIFRRKGTEGTLEYLAVSCSASFVIARASIDSRTFRNLLGVGLAGAKGSYGDRWTIETGHSRPLIHAAGNRSHDGFTGPGISLWGSLRGTPIPGLLAAESVGSCFCHACRWDPPRDARRRKQPNLHHHYHTPISQLALRVGASHQLGEQIKDSIPRQQSGVHVDDDAALDLAVQYLRAQRWHLSQVRLAGHGIESLQWQIGSEAPPGSHPLFKRLHHAVDSQ